MSLIHILVIALVGHSLADAKPNPLGPQNEPRKPMLVFATNGEGKAVEDEKKTGFRRSIPPGGALGFGGFDAGLGTGFVANTGFGFGNGLHGNSFTGNAGNFGSGLLANNFAGNAGLGLGSGLTANSFVGTGFGSGLGNNFVGNGLAGATFGVEGLNPTLQGSLSPLAFRNTMVYSPYGTNVGTFGVSAAVPNQFDLSSGFWPNRQGLTNNFSGFSGMGGLNDLSSFSGLGINGLNGFSGVNGFNNFAGVGGLSSLGGVNTFRNAGVGGLNSVSSLNGINTGTGFNNFGSLSNGINGFSSFDNRFNGLNNGLNSFSSFNTGVPGGFNINPTQFGANPFGGSNSFKRSPLDPTSPYYTRLYNSDNNDENDQQTDSGWSSNRNSGQSASGRGVNTVTSQSAGGQIRSNSNTSV
ncbi:uncharacterized PPE family protein PPE62 isoform X1 [Daphnia magna]|uniref:uncharacterized PPE family protein PPE62 isoform X1 n=1 Tax=Daphnia magna TaxID=35525 RepID=UPI001E1BBF13|nr:uncharacterized PPE family protein PPE62 isoform X1 [Daphnia magna]